MWAVFEFQSLQDKCDRLEKKSAENDNQRKSESDKTTELDRILEVSLVLVQKLNGRVRINKVVKDSTINKFF